MGPTGYRQAPTKMTGTPDFIEHGGDKRLARNRPGLYTEAHTAPAPKQGRRAQHRCQPMQCSWCCAQLCKCARRNEWGKEKKDTGVGGGSIPPTNPTRQPLPPARRSRERQSASCTPHAPASSPVSTTHTQVRPPVCRDPRVGRGPTACLPRSTGEICSNAGPTQMVLWHRGTPPYPSRPPLASRP